MSKYVALVSFVILSVLAVNAAGRAAQSEEQKPQPRTVYLLSDPHEMVPFSESKRICASHGGMQPVSILTREKHLDVVEFMASQDATTAWTSGHDLETRGQYVWTAIDTKFDYTNWLLDAPLEDNSCRCVGFKWGSGASCVGNADKCAGWTVEPCSTRMRVICEIPSASN